MTGIAYAMGAGGAGGGAAPGGDLNFIIVMVAIFAIFYFLLIRPQQKKQKETKAMLSNLAHGDTVVTVGGLHGKIAAITEQIVTLEVADKVKVKVSRTHISGVIQKATP
ncbi:MAG TPA: preprotein translocase subunit YajC [Syntrophales bacterium]|nr:preprotein translocase subunit YajC [Syntrophales bacterium]HPQ45309.1 preprotein translocase subunit YajC [Syntrophales bacterium]